MVEQETIGTPPVGATGRMRRLNTVKFNTNSPTASIRDNTDRMSFTSHVGHPSATGFTSNQRPAIYYKPSLDLTDNPQLGLSLSDSFMSQTKLHYGPPVSSHRSRSLPINKPRDISSFHQLESLTETGSLETEYQRRFQYSTPAVSLNPGILDPKRERGFTRSVNHQLNTFQIEPHQTSVTKSDFLFPSFPQGTKIKPGPRTQSCRETGFTRGDTSPVSHPSSLLPSHQTTSSAPTVMVIGKKELTGFLSNAPKNEAFPRTPFNSEHFITHYMSKF